MSRDEALGKQVFEEITERMSDQDVAILVEILDTVAKKSYAAGWLVAAEQIFEALPSYAAKDFFAAIPDAIACNGKDLSVICTGSVGIYQQPVKKQLETFLEMTKNAPILEKV